MFANREINKKYLAICNGSFSKENAYGVTFRAEYQGYKKNSFNYGVRLNYKF